MRKATVLLTSVGGLGVPKLIETLRAAPGLDLTFVGVDANPGAVGAHFIETFAPVPFGTDPGYGDAMAAVCERYRPEVLVPLSDEEAVRLARDAGRFRDRGVTVLGSSFETTSLTTNKFRFLSRLREAGLPTPKFFAPRSAGELDRALGELGYPDKSVVFKPLDLYGSRGFRLLTAGFDELAHVLTSKKEVYLSLPRLKSLLDGRREYPAFLLMEYLEGDCYSVDVLVEGGRCKYIIPQKKVAPRHGSLEVGRIEGNTDIDRAVERIVGAFDFAYLLNIDMAYRGHARDGEPLPFDLNPRPSAVVSATHAAGCSLLAEALCQALGVESPARRYTPVTMTRHWQELYTPAGRATPGDAP